MLIKIFHNHKRKYGNGSLLNEGALLQGDSFAQGDTFARRQF